MTDVLSRHEARAKGLRTYYTGRSCGAGHDAERYTSSGQCVPCLADRYAANRDKFKEASRRHYYGKTYGLSPEAADALRAATTICPCCLEPLDTKASHIDHDHQTGEVRGVLCGPCNQTLGLVKESSATLARMIAYLSESSGR